MEENENKDAVVNTEEIKEETVKTAKEVKETFKNVDIKKDAKATTNFIIEMVKDPLSRLKEIAEDVNNSDFKYAVFLIIIWMMVATIMSLKSSFYSFSSFFRYNIGGNLLFLVKSMIAPVISIIVMSAIVFFINKNNKKSFITVITAITTAKIPAIAAKVLNILTLISSKISIVLSPVSGFCNIITTVFTFFAIKALFGEEDNNNFLKTFVLIEAIYYVAYFIISFLEIYI